MSSVRWYIEGHMWLCPNCHQGSYYASGDADGKSSLECVNCGWVHMRGFWCQVKCPEGCYWPEELEAEKYFFRTQDDCDGDLSSGIGVVVDAQGDVWVETVSKSLESCRYRMPLIGGGMSPRVRNALVLLALAIKLDNETNGRV